MGINHTFLQLIFAIGLALTALTPNFAAPASLESLGQTQITEAEWNAWLTRGLDNPRGLVQELTSYWNTELVRNSTVLRARVAWLIGRFGYYDDASEVLLEGAKAARAVGMEPWANEMEFFRLEFASRDSPNFDEIKLKLRELVYHMSSEHMQAYALAQLAFHILDRGLDSPDIAPLLNELRTLMERPGFTLTVADMETLSVLSICLTNLGQELEAKAIVQKIDDFCQSSKIRHFCSSQAYEKARRIGRKDDRESQMQALPYLQESLQYAEQLQDQTLMSYGYYGLGEVYARLDQLDQALSYTQKAADSFARIGKMDWAASALTSQAVAYLANHQPRKALESAEKALKICPEEFKSDRVKIYQQLSRSHEALGSYAESLKFLRLAVAGETQLRNEDANKKYMEQRNASLAQQNAMQAEQIDLLKKFRIASILAASLLAFSCLALLMVANQARIIRGSRKLMKDVMDNIDEGLLILDRHLRIMPGYSPYMDRLLNTTAGSLEKYDFIEFITQSAGHSGGDVAMIRGTLQACIGESLLSWELNHSHLPLEIKQGAMILNLHWQPLCTPTGQISRFLVSIRDVTELRDMEKKVQQESERVSAQQQKIAEILAGRAPMIRAHIQDMRQAWPGLDEQIKKSELHAATMRLLHTWKGVSRSLGLKHLANRLHDMESSLNQQDLDEQASWAKLSVSLDDYEQLLSSLQVKPTTDGGLGSDLYGLGHFYAHEMQDRLATGNIAWQGLTILDRVLNWKKDVLPLIHQMLLHAVSNSLDHGFVRAHKAHRTLPAALIRIQAERKAQTIHITVQDNGAGIDWESLKKKAAGVDYRELLFRDGFSTAESTSETSGRGVGLSAIRSLCQDLGGSIRLESEAGAGTTLWMEFPAEKLEENGLEKSA